MVIPDVKKTDALIDELLFDNEVHHRHRSPEKTKEKKNL